MTANTHTLDLSVSDVHVPGALGNYVGGYGQTPAHGGDKRLKHAALVVVRNPTGHVLTVSRPEPPHEQAIPGGTVEQGEQPDAAAMRELKEECGIDCSALQHVCDLTSPTDGRTVHVYRANTYSGNAVAAEPNTKVAWLHPNDLLAQAKQYHTSVKAIMDAGGLDMPLAPTKSASERRKDRRDRRTMAEISTNKRNALPDESFALPALRKYPLLDPNHVRNAAARLAQAKKRGKISDADYKTASEAIAKAEKKFGIQPSVEATDTPQRRPPMHHFQISADLAHGGSLQVKHAAMTDAGGVAILPPRPITT